MAEFLEKRMVLAIKVEAVEGTAETPAGADANLLAYDVKFDPNIAQFDRRPLSATLSPYSSIPGSQMAKLSFKAELKGSGTVGTAPALGKLLKACGRSETVVPSTSVTYNPLSVGPPSVTIVCYSVPASGNNIVEKILGARGTCKISPKVGDPVLLEFDFQGVYVPTADAEALTPSGIETTKPVPFLSTAFSMHGFTGHKVSGFAIDLGNTLTMRGDISKAAGYFSCLITEKKPTFSFDPEKELVAAHDYYGKVLSGAEGALSCVIGATAGNICTITAPKAQYLKVTPGSRDGLGIFNVDGKFNLSSGDDELVFAFT